MKNQILKVLTELLQASTPQQKPRQTLIKISNEAIIANQNKNFGKFREELDPRDKQIIHPFSFTINSITGSSLSTQKFLESEQYRQIHKQLFHYLASMCENVTSIGFKLLNEGKLTENEAKDFSSKNILGNVVAILTQIIAVIKSAVRKQDIEQLAYKLTLEIDQILMEVLKNLASYYPQAPPAGNTAKMREVIVDVNRSWDESTDLIYNCGIKIDKYLRLKSWDSGQILNDYEEYTGFIMEVINSAISVTRETASEKAEETVFEKFVQFNERLFCTSNHRHFKTLMNLQKKKATNEKEDPNLLKYYRDVLEGEVLQDDNILVQAFESIKDFIPFLKRDVKQHSNGKKKLNQSELLELIKSEYDDELQKLKKESKFALAQKIPSYVKSFSKNDLKENKFFVNSSSVLRVMTKWAENLEDLFKNSEMIIKKRQYYFKNTKNELIPPSEAIKNKLHQKLGIQYKIVQEQFKKLKQKNTILQSYFMTQSSSETINSFLKRYTQVRCISSQINASLIQSMRKYLCILIHHLLKAGSDIWTGTTKQNINLIIFRVNDLLRSKFQCNQTTFINILNTLYLLDKSSEMRNKFKLVRVKNKLDQKDNNILLNYMFLGKVQCQLQLSIQDMKPKEKNYYNFSHFVYELTRGKFGVITECAIIVSQHDPVVNSCTRGMYYRPKIYQKLEKLKIQEKNPIQFKYACKKDANLFVCENCKKFVIHDNTQLFDSKENVCNKCIMKSKNAYMSIKNQKIKKYLCYNINKSLKEVTEYSQIESGKYIISISSSGKGKDLIKLFKVWYHARQFKLFFIKINSFILSSISNLQKFSDQDFDYLDAKEHQEKNKLLSELTYLCQQEHLPSIFQILSIEKQYIQKIPMFLNQFQNFRIERNIIQAIKFKSEIIDVSDDRLKLHIFNNVFQGCKFKNKKDNVHFKKYRNIEFGNLKAINLNKLNLNKVPINLKDIRNLVRLNIEDNSLKVIDLSSVPFLTSLDISNNSLTQIDFSKNIHLTSLSIDSNQLTSINLAMNINLISLNMRRNLLTNIDLNQNTMLSSLNLFKNKLKKIDLRANSNLTSLNLSNNELSEINLSQKTRLTELYLSNNKLEYIDLKENVELVNLNIFCNNLTDIDLSKNSALTNLSLYSNRLTAIDLTQNINLTSLALYKNQLTTINLSRNQQLTNLNLFGNMLSEVNLTNNPALTILNLYNNQLMTIDLTKNIHLVTLDLSYNQLRSVDLTRNAILANLDLRNNALQMALDLSKNNQLTGFSLNFNRLSIVRFYYNTELTLNSIDLRNQQSEKEKCDVEVTYGKLDQIRCKEFVNQLKANPYYKKYNFVLKVNV